MNANDKTRHLSQVPDCCYKDHANTCYVDPNIVGPGKMRVDPLIFPGRTHKCLFQILLTIMFDAHYGVRGSMYKNNLTSSTLFWFILLDHITCKGWLISLIVQYIKSCKIWNDDNIDLSITGNIDR